MLKRPDMTSEARDIAQVAVPSCVLGDPVGFGGREEGGFRVGTLHLRGDAVVGMTASFDPVQRLVLPKLTEPQVHLDKCHTIERLGAIGGDLATAVAAQSADKAAWTANDLDARMRRGLRELAQAGCGTVRTHIDWSNSEDPPLAWEIACGLRGDARDLGLDLQVAALTGIDLLADANFASAVAKRVSRDQGVLGAFVLRHSHREAGLKNAFVVAEKFGLALDFHVDEGLDPALDGIEIIPRVAQQIRFEGPILCGHACSLASKTSTQVAQFAEDLASNGISVVTLPTTNLYLQGRNAGTPKSRGLTRVHELSRSGVNVVLGTDNVRDAFCPIGRHDPINSLGVAVLAAHLDPPLVQHMPMITTGAQRALGVQAQTVDGATEDDLIVFERPDLSSLVADPARPIRISELAQGETANG